LRKDFSFDKKIVDNNNVANDEKKNEQTHFFFELLKLPNFLNFEEFEKIFNENENKNKIENIINENKIIKLIQFMLNNEKIFTTNKKIIFDANDLLNIFEIFSKVNTNNVNTEEDLELYRTFIFNAANAFTNQKFLRLFFIFENFLKIHEWVTENSNFFLEFLKQINTSNSIENSKNEKNLEITDVLYLFVIKNFEKNTNENFNKNFYENFNNNNNNNNVSLSFKYLFSIHSLDDKVAVAMKNQKKI
jgi:hypothetical protein